MICDDSRPCQRCIKRGIGHLCYDEPTNPRQKKKVQALKSSLPEKSPSVKDQIIVENTIPGHSELSLQENPELQPNTVKNLNPVIPERNKANKSVLSQTIPFNPEPFFYSEHAGSEFSSLNDFLSMIDDPDLVNGALNNSPDPLLNFSMENQESLGNLFNQPFNVFKAPKQQDQEVTAAPDAGSPLKLPSAPPKEGQQSITVGKDHQPIISDSARDKFFLTAADPTTEISPGERLKQVIKAKLEAGLLQPYNYAKGYARLQNYMDNYMNATSRQRILKPLSVFRPAFRAIARTLKDVDLVLVEESFERMLLDYDRVFTSMAIPACLWRRTGEIYRGNKEFASLVGVTTDDLKDGKLAIYELMSEESAVNFWEKYGAIAFDKGQKAVLTSCNLRTRDGIKRKSCCFSFTIRRDRYNIPSCIVGNFIPIDP